MPLASGSKLGPYEVVVPLGAGGMGEVFLARDTRVGRQVALKLLPEGVASDPQKAARFEREARLLAHLNHPNVAALYEFDEAEGTRFLVLEYVPGETLADRVRRGRPPALEALEAARQIAVALEAAHRRGVVHRDLKPANVKVTPEGQVKLLDFGLAKALEGEGSAPPSDGISEADAHAGLVVGTAAYMSPEQARGLPLDPRTDLWSFGCVLYELLTGKQAFSGSSISDLLASILVKEPDWSALPEETPGAVRVLLRRCLQKEADFRPPDAGVVAAELALVLSGRADVAETRALAGSGDRRLRRRALSVAASGIGLLVLVGAAALLGLRAMRARPASPVLPESRVLAVLPFRDLTGRPDGPLVADGLAESLSAQLARAAGVQVLTPLATGPFRDDAEPTRLSRALGATLVLRGSVQRAGELVRVTWLVLSASGGAPVGGSTETGTASELFALQDRVAAGVVASLGLGPASGVAGGGPRGASAQERYLAALGHLQSYQDAASVDAAVTGLEALAAEEPGWAAARAALARAYLAKRFTTREPAWAERAREACREAERIDPGLPDVQLTLGRVAAETGDAEGAIAAFRKVLGSRPGDVEALLGLADACLLGGKSGPAEEAARRAVAAGPAYWAAHNKLGVVLASTGRPAEATAAFRKAVELAPENAVGLANLGSALLLEGRLPDAAATLRRSVALDETAEGLSALGTVEYSLGRYDEAAAAYGKAVALAPAFSTLWVNLGDARRWSAAGRAKAAEAYARAVEAAREELRVNPSDADAHLSLALAFAKMGRSAEAAAHLRAALDADPANPDRLFQGAVVEAASGRPEEAARLLRLAVEKGAPAWQVDAEPELDAVRAELRGTDARGERAKGR